MDKEKQFLKDLQQTLQGGAVQPNELVAVVRLLLTLVKNLDTKLSTTIDDKDKKVSQRTETINQQMLTTANRLEKLINDTKASAVKDINATAQRLIAQIQAVADRIPGDPDFSNVWERINEVEKKIPTNLQNLDGEDIRNYLEALTDDDRLRIEAIRGLTELIDELKNPAAQNSVKAGGVPRGLHFLIDGVKKGIISNMNFKAGTGVSIAYSKVNGQDTITFNATGGGGGGGVTVETPAETPDGVITEFTVTAEPQWVVADGITYYDGEGYTYSSLTVTMDVAPSAFIRVII